MNHANMQHEGAYSFGLAKRGHDSLLAKDTPGPGTHNIISQTATPAWKIGTSQRSKPRKLYGAPVGTYNPEDHLTHFSGYEYGFGSEERPKLDKPNLTSFVDTNPRQETVKKRQPSFSMGYKADMSPKAEERPGPGTYHESIVRSPKYQNTSQHDFSLTEKIDLSKGPEYPSVGQYEVIPTSHSPIIKFGTSKRRSLSNLESLCKGDYHISGRIGGKGEGYTFGQKLSKQINSNDYPSPSKYLPALPQSKASIFMSRSNRPSPVNREQVEYPSPGKYEIARPLEQGINFTKGPRSEMMTSKTPGVGTYTFKDEKLNHLGRINDQLLIPLREKFVTPAPGTYSPNHSYTERKGRQAIIHLSSQRSDFTKSPTQKLGPGAYDIMKKFEQELGLFCSKTERIRLQANQTPGPGSYELPPTLGMIPDYHHSLSRKISSNGKIPTKSTTKNTTISVSEPVNQTSKEHLGSVPSGSVL